MNKGKRFLKWGLLILAALIYVGIGAIPFLNNVQATGKTGILKILTVGEMVVLGVMLAIVIAVVVFCLKKRELYFTHSRFYIGFGKLSFVSEFAEGIFKLFA